MIRLVTIAALSLAVYSCAISNDSDFLGYAPGMNETAEAMTGGDRFDKIAENPFVKTKDQNVSTFSIDADGASYTIMRKICQKRLGCRTSVRQDRGVPELFHV